MKKSILFCLMLGWVNLAYSQAPQGIPYQAAIRDDQGLPLLNSSINIRFSIIDSVPNGTIIFQETHIVNTNEFGLINLILGSGSATIGAFNSINWGVNSKFIQVECDQTVTGNNFSTMGGVQQMMSVPYALYSASSGSVVNQGNSNPTSTSSVQHKIGISNSANWVCPLGVTQVVVELWGGGGGGGHWWNIGSSGQRGGDGGYIKETVSVTPGQSYFITIGQGGSAPCNICGSAGNGGNSSFGSILVAYGGTGASQPTGQAPSGAITNYNYSNAGFTVGTRSYIPSGYVVNEPFISNGGAPGQNNGDGAGKAGEAGYCILTYNQ